MVRWFDVFPEHAPPKVKRTWQESKAMADLWIRDQLSRKGSPAKPRGKRGR